MLLGKAGKTNHGNHVDVYADFGSAGGFVFNCQCLFVETRVIWTRLFAVDINSGSHGGAFGCEPGCPDKGKVCRNYFNLTLLPG